MSERHEPPRLLEGDAAFGELHPGLQQARASGPSAEQVARMRSALGLPAGAPAAAPTVARVSLLKLAVLGAAIAAGFGTWRVLRVPLPAHPSAAPAATHGAGIRSPARTTEPRLESEAPPPLPPRAAERSGAPGARTTTPNPSEGTRPNAAPAQDPGAELALLKRAKADARSEPAQALARVAEHERRFPHGLLVEEREVIAIEALLASGQRAAGFARAERFFTSFPHSAHARRVRALLADANATHSDTKPASAPHPSR